MWCVCDAQKKDELKAQVEQFLAEESTACASNTAEATADTDSHAEQDIPVTDSSV